MEDETLKEINHHISEVLKKYREHLGYTRKQVSEELGISRETLRKYESNPITMDIGLFLQFLNFYKIDPPIFFNKIYGKLPFEFIFNPDD